MVMRYIKPSWFLARIVNRIALATGVVNSEPMIVIKRRSKLSQTIPMTPVDLGGVKYVVSVRGETERVKNVRANPHIKLPKSGATDYVATEVPIQARKRILDVYKTTASKATNRLFRQLPEDADHPVFVLTPLLRPIDKIDMITTRDAFLRCERSWLQTAALGVHHQTVSYRIGRIEQITETATIAEFRLALRANDSLVVPH
jgi:hypothetical protein